MEHLALEIFDLATKENPKPTGSQYAMLEPDATITITDTGEVFGKGDVWSYNFTLNVHANAHLFGTAGEIHGSRLHEQINKRKARLWLDGIAMHLGYLKLDSEAEVDADGNVDVTFESGQHTFDEMIDGAKANQVPMMNDVLIGMAHWRKRWTKFRAQLSLSVSIDYYGNRLELDGDINNGEWFDFEYDGEEEGNSVQEYPRMVYPGGFFPSREYADQNWDDNLVNTDSPYTEDDNGTPTHPYCNVALCYQKQGYDKLQKDGSTQADYSGEPVAQRGYEYMPANRVNSAPCFFVIYWLRCLMNHLGFYVEENQMMDVDDLRRLFFVNTNCAYEEPQKLRTSAYNKRYGRYRSSVKFPEYIDAKKNISIDGSGFKCEQIKMTGGEGTLLGATANISKVDDMSEQEKVHYRRNNNFYHLAYATSDCFPNVDISEVISAIESGFGVRLLFSNDYKRVRIVLLRNVFRSEEVQDIACEIVDEDVKVENNIRGFRMTYGNTEDTHFYYKGFADMLPHKKELWVDDSDKHDYSKWNLNAEYSSLIHKVSAFDTTCYVTPDTGNAYGIKIDKNAKRYDELYPSIFGFADFMDAEDGDCAGEEETIKTINVNFAPAIMNDLNMEQERKGRYDQRFALFVDETMRVRRFDFQDGTDYNSPAVEYDVEGKLYAKDNDEYVYEKMMHGDGIVAPGEFAIRSDMYASAKNVTAYVPWAAGFSIEDFDFLFDISGHINEGYRLYLQDNFEPNDTGISPIETHDWGLTLGIMRGSGSDAYVKYEFDPDDGEGNDTWERMAGSSVTAHPDTCDNYGRTWDYNGANPGTGNEEGRVSLKLRAEKPNPYFDPSKEETHYDPEHPELNTNPRYLHIDNQNLQGRGLCDQFYKEYSYWIRNARIVKRTVRMTLAQLLTIDKTKRVRVGDVTGFIRKMQYSVSNETGLGNVVMEIMYI